jgi:hypothetical protein
MSPHIGFKCEGETTSLCLFNDASEAFCRSNPFFDRGSIFCNEAVRGEKGPLEKWGEVLIALECDGGVVRLGREERFVKAYSTRCIDVEEEFAVCLHEGDGWVGDETPFTCECHAVRAERKAGAALLLGAFKWRSNALDFTREGAKAVCIELGWDECEAEVLSKGWGKRFLFTVLCDEKGLHYPALI